MSRFRRTFDIFAVFQASAPWAGIAAAVCGRRTLSLFLINWADNLLKALNALGVCMLCKINRRNKIQDRRRRRWWRVLMNETWRVTPLKPQQEDSRETRNESFYKYSTKDYYIVSRVSMKLVLQFYSFRILRWEESAWNVREVTGTFTQLPTRCILRRAFLSKI